MIVITKLRKRTDFAFSSFTHNDIFSAWPTGGGGRRKNWRKPFWPSLLFFWTPQPFRKDTRIAQTKSDMDQNIYFKS